MFESNKQSSIGSTSSNDELGMLIELFTSQFDLQQCLIKLAHIIRVWLGLAEDALFFY